MGNYDKIKQIREKNPIKDFLVGFIPGVGEAQDIHDFYYAVRDKDYLSGLLYAAGLVLPVATGGQIKKGVKLVKKLVTKEKELPESLVSKGWKQVDGKIFSPKGEEFVYTNEGRLQSKSSFDQTQKVEGQKAKLIERQKNMKKNIDKFNDKANEFADRTGFLSFNTEIWQAGIPKSARMSEEQLQQYITEGGPTIMKHFDTLMKNGAKENPGTYALRGSKGNYEAYFPTSLPLKGKLADQYKAGWRKVSNADAELYLIQTSPNAAGKFEITGIPMYRGINQNMIPGFKRGKPQSWYSSLVENAEHYKKLNERNGHLGMGFYGAPVKTDKTHINIVRTEKANPSSTHWNSSGPDPIGAHLSNDPNAINITETYLTDDVSSRRPQLWTILGKNVQTKAVKGGTGMFDLTKANPLLQWSIPVGLATTIGFKTLNNEDKKH